MARSGFPSMTALLGLLAVAGYQNRDRIAEMMRQHGGGMGGSGGPGGQMSGQMGGFGGQAGGQAGGLPGGLGGLLGGGLGEMSQRFRQNGRGDVMESWVGTGPNRNIEPHDLEAALGPEVLEDLTETTGLSRQEILQRLSRELPDAVDRYTPQGRLPEGHEFG